MYWPAWRMCIAYHWKVIAINVNDGNKSLQFNWIQSLFWTRQNSLYCIKRTFLPRRSLLVLILGCPAPVKFTSNWWNFKLTVFELTVFSCICRFSNKNHEIADQFSSVGIIGGGGGGRPEPLLDPSLPLVYFWSSPMDFECTEVSKGFVLVVFTFVLHYGKTAEELCSSWLEQYEVITAPRPVRNATVSGRLRLESNSEHCDQSTSIPKVHFLPVYFCIFSVRGTRNWKG